MNNTSEQLATGRNIDNRSVAGQERKTIRRLSKTHVKYWEKRLYRRKYAKGGDLVEIANWQIHLYHAKRDRWFNLGTPNKAAATEKAKGIATFLNANGWEATLAKYAPASVAPDRNNCTVGEYLDVVATNSELSRITLGIYARKFRTLLSGVFKVKGEKEKFDYIAGGNKAWLERINRIRLARVTAERVEKWKTDYIKAAEKENPLALKQAYITLNSIVRASKALFCGKIVDKIKNAIKLPSPLPMSGVTRVHIERQRYISKIDIYPLLTAARTELAQCSPEVYKIFLLATCAGLRRDEIDNLLWRNVDFIKNAIRIETTEFSSPKSSFSERAIDADPRLLQELKKTMIPGCGIFVIKSDKKPKIRSCATYSYRAEKSFNELVKWLRDKGVSTNNPIHALRKEFGSHIAAHAGIYAASMALGHADIQLTKDYYLDKKTTVFFAINPEKHGEDKDLNPGQPESRATHDLHVQAESVA